MKINVETNQPMTDESIKAATGRNWEEWFAYLDAWDAKGKGRRETGVHLYYDLKLGDWWSPTIGVEYEAARGMREKDGKLRGYMICSTKTINAQMPEIYAAWSSPEQLDRWFGEGNKATFEDGGTFENADGNRGEFKRVRKDKDIRLVWKDPRCGEGTPVDVTFTAKGDKKCLMMLSHDRIQTRAEADGLRNAWGAAFDRLKSTLESG
jgi:uncharacterized protein YndB with AHSA1/START domain